MTIPLHLAWPRAGVALVTLDHPPVNAVDQAMACALGAAAAALEADEAVRAVVLAGAPPHFCAGADLASLRAGQPHAFFSTPEGGFAGFVRLPRAKPWIAAVQGGAIGGGFEIVLACDLVVAAEDARFALPEVRHGIVAASGGVQRAPRRLPPAIAREMLLTGLPLAAARAHALGLVNRLVPAADVLAAALDLAAQVASHPPGAVRAALALSRAAEAGEAEDLLFARARAVSDQLRGV